jgi:hypothetical protein
VGNGIASMYRQYYAKLRHSGVTGVKVDGQALVEALASDVGMTCV